jgi:ankyrin repeat protein
LAALFLFASPLALSAQSLNDRFIQAATAGDLQLVTQLLREGANIEARDGSDRQTALVFAANRGHLPVVRFLIENRADKNATDDRGWTALSESSYHGRIDVVEYMLSSGASTIISTNWHDRREYGNALFWCIESSHNTLPQKIRIVELLLKSDADPEGRDAQGRDALRIARDNNYREIVDMLTRVAAQREKDRREYRLLAAIRAQDERAVRQLLGEGANPNLLLDNGESILNYAVAGQNVNMVSILLDAGAGANIGNGLGITPLMTASRHEYIAIIDLLLGRGANLNARDSGGKTVLFYAVESGNIDMISRFLRSGASVNTTDRMGGNVLHYAVAMGNAAVVNMLLSSGANVNTMDMLGNTALLIAAQKGNFNVFNTLVSRGADPHIRNGDGLTAADFARKNHNAQILKLLGEE